MAGRLWRERPCGRRRRARAGRGRAAAASVPWRARTHAKPPGVPSRSRVARPCNPTCWRLASPCVRLRPHASDAPRRLRVGMHRHALLPVVVDLAPALLRSLLNFVAVARLVPASEHRLRVKPAVADELRELAENAAPRAQASAHAGGRPRGRSELERMPLLRARRTRVRAERSSGHASLRVPRLWRGPQMPWVGGRGGEEGGRPLRDRLRIERIGLAVSNRQAGAAQQACLERVAGTQQRGQRVGGAP